MPFSGTISPISFLFPKKTHTHMSIPLPLSFPKESDMRNDTISIKGPSLCISMMLIQWVPTNRTMAWIDTIEWFWPNS